MRYIADLVYEVKEELMGAKEAAEKAVYYKSQGTANNTNATRNKLYNEIATDELKHAKYYHDMITEEVNKLKDVYKPTSEMMKMWEEAHNQYVEEYAWIKQMLAM